jgi:hypothetical protein
LQCPTFSPGSKPYAKISDWPEKNLFGTNDVAYFASPSATKKKSFSKFVTRPGLEEEVQEEL